MAGYDIYFKESVWKDIHKIPKKCLQAILRKIKELSENPRPFGCERLTGQDRYRLRQRRYRVVYSIQDKALTIWLVTFGHRNDVYR